MLTDLVKLIKRPSIQVKFRFTKKEIIFFQSDYFKPMPLCCIILLFAFLKRRYWMSLI